MKKYVETRWLKRLSFIVFDLQFFFWLIFEWLSFDCDEVDMAMLTGEGSGVESPVIVHNIRNALFGD